MAEKPKAILVLGMHRSGTSAITRVLNLLGMQLPGELMAPVAEAPADMPTTVVPTPDWKG